MWHGARMTNSDAPRRAIVPSFRALAKDHALAAATLTEKAATATVLDGYSPEQVDDMFELAKLHALVSLACSEVAPPERRACTSRTVDLTAPAVN